jgi:hypothetical protein
MFTLPRPKMKMDDPIEVLIPEARQRLRRRHVRATASGGGNADWVMAWLQLP